MSFDGRMAAFGVLPRPLFMFGRADLVMSAVTRGRDHGR